MKVSAKQDQIKATDEKIYQLISNPQNFAEFLPAQLEQKECTPEFCKFTIPGMATLTLRVSEKTPFCKVVYTAENDKNIPITIELLIENHSETSEVEVGIEAAVPAFLSGMIKNPLQHLANMIVEKIKLFAEK